MLLRVATTENWTDTILCPQRSFFMFRGGGFEKKKKTLFNGEYACVPRRVCSAAPVQRRPFSGVRTVAPISPVPGGYVTIGRRRTGAGHSMADLYHVIAGEPITKRSRVVATLNSIQGL